MNNVEYIPLVLSPVRKLLHAVLAGWFILGGSKAFLELVSVEKLQDFVINLLIIIFSGLGSSIMVWIITRPPGRIEVRPEGILIQNIFTVGMVDWSNLAQVGAVNVQWKSHLGIRLENVERYLASRELLQDKRSIRDVKVMNFALRVLFPIVKLPIVKQCLDYINNLLGLVSVPERLREIDVLEINMKNYVYHLLLAGFLLPTKSAQIAEQLNVALDRARQNIGFARNAAPPRPSKKECPMCAEIVKAKAKICRFCGHKFDAI